MRWLLIWIMNYLHPAATLCAVALQTTVIAGGALLLIRAAPRQSALRHAFAVSALVCLLVSPVIYGVAARAGWCIDVPSMLMDSNPSVDRQHATLADLSIVLRDELRALEGARAMAHLYRQQAVRWAILLLGIWISASCALLGRLLVSLHAMRAIYRQAQPIDLQAYRDVLHKAAAALNIRHYPSVCSSTQVTTPVTSGMLGKTRILLPKDYIESASSDELMQVLVHEGAHAIRRDNLVLLLQEFSRVMFWWHPLVHTLHRELNRAREEVCDNYVLRSVGSAGYANTLFRLATMSPRPIRPPAVIGLVNDGLEPGKANSWHSR